MTTFPLTSHLFTLPFVQNGSFTTSAGKRSPRQSTSNFVPGFALAAGRYVVPIPTPSDGLSVPLRTTSTSRPLLPWAGLRGVPS